MTTSPKRYLYDAMLVHVVCFVNMAEVDPAASVRAMPPPAVA